MHEKRTRVAPFGDLLAGGTRRRLAALLDEQQEQVREIDHQADRHGNQQVEHQIGVFRLQFIG